MALQLGLRSSMSLATRASSRTSMQSTIGVGFSSQLQQSNNRWMSSTDAGDVIGIDLGTTNSCVAIMVSGSYTYDMQAHVCYITHRNAHMICTLYYTTSHTITITGRT